MLDIPYSTGSALSTAITFDKGVTQTILRSRGFGVADFLHLSRSSKLTEENIVHQLGLPCFVKPTQAGSSLGVSKVKRLEHLAKAMDDAFAISSNIIIESELVGREITCGVVRRGDEVVALPVTEILFEGEFFDYEAKYNDTRTREVTPAQIDSDSYARCQLLAKEVYQAMDCRGIARIDFFLCDGDLYVVEINTVPGMSPASIVPKMFSVSGLNLTAILTEIITEQTNESKTT